MDISSQFLGFIVGILSSWAFWYLLITMKPKILVSDHAVYNPEKGSLLIKIRNTRNRQATEIQANLTVIEQYPDGRLFTQYTANLRKNSLFALAPLRDLKKSWSLPATYIFATDEGKTIMQLLSTQTNGEKRVVFTLSATDGLSGTRVVQQVSYRLQDIQQGKFGLGFSIEKVLSSTPEEESRIEN